MSNNKKIIKVAYYTMFMESEDSGVSEKTMSVYDRINRQ